MKSLVLAGGGLKVAYQAGCLQVLHELGIEFDHVDAASGGCFNAAMLASGKTGTEIANHWRSMDPKAFTTIDWRSILKLPYARAVGTDAGLRKIFGKIWRLDFAEIRRKKATTYTFNVYDFTRKAVEVIENTALDEETLIATVSLMMWLPVVERGNNRFFDAVWATDGSVGEAVRRGADEIWAIWTVTDTPEIRNGFLAQYFHLIETVASAKFKQEWAEIEAVNRAIATHGPTNGRGPDLQLRAGFDPETVELEKPPPGRKHIKQHLIRQEVPMHYLFALNRDRVAAAVEMGVRDMRAYAGSMGHVPTLGTATDCNSPSVQFSETMRGFFLPGATDPQEGERDGCVAGNTITLRLDIATDDLDRFLHQPEHLGSVSGAVDCPLLSGAPMRVQSGSFSLFVNDRRSNGMTIPGQKRMLYSLECENLSGTRFRLNGVKYIRQGNPLEVWPATTTLYVTIVSRDSGAPEFAPFGAGVVHVRVLDFIKELVSFDVPTAGGLRPRFAALGRFGTFFAGQLWDVYARKVLDYAPF